MIKQRLRMLEDRVLRRILGLEKDEATECWRISITRSFIMCSHSSPNVIAIIKSKRA
jgi:hypothetical protein